ncbi:uncharacterized protein [Henckelia pumila]|uniref:uncharacterized protein n=1 Tax=Henckelia pumila TaxID=405737 RepID=UPI003C6E422C
MSEPNVESRSQQVDLNSLRSRILELRNVSENPELSNQDEENMFNVIIELERKFSQAVSECSSDVSSLANEDLDELLEQLKKELNAVEGENANTENEIIELLRRCVEDNDKLECELEKLGCSLDFMESQKLDQEKQDEQTNVSHEAASKETLSNAHDSSFEMLELNHLIEKNKTILKSLQALDSSIQRFEAVEKIEDALTGLRVIDFEGNHIRLSLKTHIPNLESVLCQQEIEGVIVPELNHVLTIETMDGTFELKNVEVFPNDIYIGDIVDAARSFRLLHPPFAVIRTRSSLEWFVRRVQDRISLSSLRRIVVKNAKKLRHSFEYLDKEDTVVAHMVGGIDAFIKLSQGWPTLNSTLELISLKSSSQQSKEISLAGLCIIVESANSMNASRRHNISSFVDGIEEILMKQMRTELQSDAIPTK